MGEPLIPDDLVGVRMVHVVTGDVVEIVDRKTDDSGWWVKGGGGLCDEVLADGTWARLATVLAHWRTTTHSGRTTDG